jgi:uncharacterized linocin/CFP29 family protein
MTSTNHLLRDQAPIPASAWKLIDEEARERLTSRLAARRVVDWSGPLGWAHSATNLGRTAAIGSAPPGTETGPDDVGARLRRVQPLVEFRVPFTVERAELFDAERGAVDLRLDDLDRAARLAAEIENRAVFHGWPDAGITGIVPAATVDGGLGTDTSSYPAAVASAVTELRLSGIEGPFALAVDPATYTRIAGTAEHGGYLLHEHLERILGGKVVWTPGLDGAVVLSQRGGDFVLEIGQDLAVGYSHHDADTVTLFFEESLSFRVTEPDAALVLGHSG